MMAVNNTIPSLAYRYVQLHGHKVKTLRVRACVDCDGTDGTLPIGTLTHLPIVVDH